MQATGESGGRKRKRHRSTPRDAAVQAQTREQAGRKKAQERVRANERNPVAAPDQYRYAPQHELPADPGRRAAMIERVRRYRAVTGRNLLKQESMGEAYAKAGLMWDAPYGSTRAFPGGLPTPQQYHPSSDGWIANDLDAYVGQQEAARVQQEAARSVGSDLYRERVVDGRPHPGDEGAIFVSKGNDRNAQVRPDVIGQTIGRDTTWDFVPGHVRRLAGQVYDLPNRLMEEGDAYRRGVRTIRDTAGYLVDETRRFDLPDINLDVKFAADAYAAGDTEYVDKVKSGELGEHFLTDAQRTLAMDAATANGWGDYLALKGLDDWELWKRANQQKPGRGTRLLAGVASNVGAMAAVIPGVKAGVEAWTSGNGPQWTWDAFAQPYVDLARDPVNYANDNPLFAATMLMGGAKAAGRGVDLGVRAGSFGRRQIVTPGRRVVNAPFADIPTTLDLGRKSTNPTTRAQQIIQERRLTGRRALAFGDRPLEMTDKRTAKLRERQNKVVAEQRLAEQTRRERAAQAAIYDKPETANRIIIERAVPTPVQIVVQRVRNYGHDVDSYVAEEMRYVDDFEAKAEKLAAKSEEMRVAGEADWQVVAGRAQAAYKIAQDHRKNARLVEEAAAAYDEWIGGSSRVRLPGDTGKVAPVHAHEEIARRYADALEAEHTNVGEPSFQDFTGLEPRNLDEQIATRHMHAIADEQKVERTRIKTEQGALRRTYGDARKDVVKDAMTRMREAARIESGALRDALKAKDKAVRDAAAAAVAAQRALKKGVEDVRKTEGAQRRMARRPHKIDHIDVTPDGRVRGASDLTKKITEEERANGILARFQLRPGVIVEKIATKGARLDPNAVREGGIRGFHEDYRVLIGSDGWDVRTLEGDRMVPERFDTLRDAVRFARRFDGIDTRRPSLDIVKGDRGVKLILRREDEVATLRRALDDTDATFGTDEEIAARADAQTRLDDLELTPTEKVHRRLNALIDEHAKAFEALAEARGARAPAEDWGDLASAAKMRRDAEAMRAAADIRPGRAPLEARPGATPAEEAMVAAANRIHELRAARKERIAAVQQRVVDRVKEENPDAGRFYVPDTAQAHLGGLSARKTRKSMNLSGEQALGGHTKENRGVLFKEGKATLAPLAGDANLRASYAAELLDAFERTWHDAPRAREGQVIDLDREVPVVMGGVKNSAKMRAKSAQFLAQVEGLSEKMGRRVTPEERAAMLRDVITLGVESELKKADDGSIVVVGKNVRILPRAAVDRIVLDYERRGRVTSPMGVDTLGEFNKWQRMVMLNSTFGTLARNAIGGAQFAAASGVTPIDIGIATRELRRAKKARRAGETYSSKYLPPNEALNNGLVSAIAGTPIHEARLFQAQLLGRRPLLWAGKMMDWFRRNNTFVENYWRSTTWIHEARKHARSKADLGFVERVEERFLKTNAEFDRALADVKAGRVPETNDLLRTLNEWHGDLGRMRKFDVQLGAVIAFHKWYQHILEQVFITLPFKHPGVGHLIQQLGVQGEEYVREHGILPAWLNDSVPLKFIISEAIGDRAPDLVELSWASGGANVWATPSQLVRTNPETGIWEPATAIGAMLPAYNAAYSIALGDTPANAMYRQAFGGDPPVTSTGENPTLGDRAVYAANQVARLFTPINTIFPSGGNDPYSPFFNPRPKYRSAYSPSQDFADLSYPDADAKDWRMLPEYAPPTSAEALGDMVGNDTAGRVLDSFLRYIGATTRAYAVGDSPRAQFQTTRSLEFMRQNAMRRQTQQQKIDAEKEYDKMRAKVREHRAKAEAMKGQK